MTKIERLYEEEKLAAVQEAEARAAARAKEEKTDTINAIASKLLHGGMAEAEVSGYTGLPLASVRQLAAMG